MIQKVFGMILIGVGCVGLTFIVFERMFFPHILGPIILLAAGIMLLTRKPKGEEDKNEKVDKIIPND